jgi:hypothetical protein
VFALATAGCSKDTNSVSTAESPPPADPAPAAAPTAAPAAVEKPVVTETEPVELASSSALAKIANFYGDYVDADYEITEDDEADPDDDSETKKEKRDIRKSKKNDAKIHWIKLLPDNGFHCNGSNYSKEVRRLKYYVSEATDSGFTMYFEDASSARNLVFEYEEEGDRTVLTFIEGKAPSDCGWSLSEGSFLRTKVKKGNAPTHKPAPSLDFEATGESVEVKSGANVEGPRGSLRVKKFRFMRKIGWSKADEGEQIGQIGVEVVAKKSAALDMEAFYSDGCDDFYTEWSCDEGGNSGDIGSCNQPHWGSKFDGGIIASGRKAKFNCCYTFEKPSKGCKVTIDGRAFGLGDVVVEL